MKQNTSIHQKLESFIQKYYFNELIRGTILFLGLGLLYLIFNLLVEYFLWLPVLGRTFLFWLFVAVELFLFIRFIAFPLFKLFHLQKGLSYTEASKIIGTHFSSIKDKLLNYLQLAEANQQSELLLASIEQKAAELTPIPFTKAVNFKTNYKFLPYLVLPIFLLVLFFISGNSDVLSQSYQRMVQYNTTFTPPPLYQLKVLNPVLQVKQNDAFTLKISTVGRVIPESISIKMGREVYLMQKNEANIFEYTFENVQQNRSFSCVTPSFETSEYLLEVVKVPSIESFQLKISYPSHTKKLPEVMQGTGNALVPEGSVVFWTIKTKATEWVSFQFQGKQVVLPSSDNLFSLQKQVRSDFDYTVMTSNENFKSYEKIPYKISVLKDQFPSIDITEAPDSLQLKKNYLIGKVSDDYGLSKLLIRYYPKEAPKNMQSAVLPVKGSVDSFVYSFPNGLQVTEGVAYEYYFEVFDNDAINHFKSTKSMVFSYRLATQTEVEEQLLKEQNQNIQSLQKGIQTNEKQLKELQNLQKTTKEKPTLDFKEQKQLQDFINRQQQQDEMMKEFTKKLEENFQEFQPEKTDEVKKELQRRLDENQKALEKKEKLLKELEELNKKISDEKLFEKLEQLKKESKNQTKSLEQLVELTKRYYVEKKAEQLAEQIDKLADKQEKLAEQKDRLNKFLESKENQDKLTKEFNDFKKELDALEKENKELKKPLDLERDEKEEQEISKEQNKASDNLSKENKESAKKNQKSAAQKMKALGMQMQQNMQSGEMDQMEEDVAMLRQILDNMLAFSFEQEALMNDFKKQNTKSLNFANLLKKQQNLKNQFKHIDDSIFAMAVRNEKITEKIINVVGDVHYNIDNSITNLAEGDTYKGVSNQQYTVTNTNKLADFLSDIMNSMQMQMSGMGQGKSGKGKGQGSSGKDKQLSDIIKKQGELSEKMQEGMKKGQKPGSSNKDGKGEGKSGKEGSEKGKGEQGGQGEEPGEDGESSAGNLLQIIKEQQQLRDALEKELDKKGLNGNGQNALNQMKDIEKQLINKGFKNEVFQKMLNLKHELLKLEKAIQQQGEDNKRESETNKQNYQNKANQLPKELQNYIQSIEILNRETLPLQPIYNQKTQNYFKQP